MNGPSLVGSFANHRKYESKAKIDDVMASYIAWVGESGSQYTRWSEIVREAGNDPATVFDAAYSAFEVVRFGRLGKFDLLTLLGRLGFFPMEAGRVHIRGASGPRRGAVDLFGPPNDADRLERRSADLADHLSVSAAVLEDAICNWQKSPDRFQHFKG